MTSVTDECNRSLQKIGTRTTVTDAEIAGNLSNEAIQFNLCYAEVRDKLLRMAPWDSGLKTANLVYITSVPGTPENTSAATNLWQPGIPAPPWAYEYQYPYDCLRMCWLIPANQTGFASGVPITTAVTGGASTLWTGTPVKYKIQNDQFLPVLSATVVNGGTGHAVGDIITLAAGLNSNPPIGAPAQLQVLTEAGGVIETVTVVSVLNGEASPLGGSYFTAQANPVAQGSTTGVGINATFNLTFGSVVSQRVILTNQEYATGTYVQQVTDPNLFDPLFRDALYNVVGATLVMGLTGDKKLANMAIGLANDTIIKARSIDGNEGLTVNDVTPDWIRTRGVCWTEGLYSGPYGSGFDWGGLWDPW
jgi:hypothetical protein